mmetsp:Transcript_24582/g.47865  ORF Transcript_24582/g.47865 Transcript_24582/m.47865 type:complete len:453 (+) Transcript_24582:100-1458(+)
MIRYYHTRHCWQAMQASLVLLAAVRVSGMPDPTRPWVPRFLDSYPLAICNDGSPAAYFYRQGLEGSRRWFVYLDGVGWCWDNESCENNWKRIHGTSNGFSKTEAELKPRADMYLNTGIFDPKRSPIKDAHVAFVKSCSNDAFMGDKSPPDPTNLPPWPLRKAEDGWHFRGRRIIEAVFKDLRTRTPFLGRMVGDRVIYGGCSAGARGAIATMDYVSGSSEIVGKAGVVGLLDSGLWVPISPTSQALAPGWKSFGQQTRAAMKMVNASALITGPCLERYQRQERWKCLMASYRLPFVRTPYFLVHSQYDRFALGMNIFGHWFQGKTVGGSGTPNEEWAEKYRQLVRGYLPNPQNGSGIVVYSPACFFHCVMTKVSFWTTFANGLYLVKVLEEWLESPDTAGSKIIENCKGFNCGSKIPRLRLLQHVEARRAGTLVEDPAAMDRKIGGVPILLT